MSIAHDRPRFSSEAACRLARALYDLSVSASPLPSERDQNFYLQAGDGREFVLKIASAAEDRAILDLQHQALARLAGQPILCPQLCLTSAGEQMATAAGPNGSSHLVRLLTYVHGAPLAEFRPHSPQLLYRLGRTLGSMDRALASLSHPAMHREIKWDMQQAPLVIRRHLEEIVTPERQRLVQHFLDRFESWAAPRLAGLRTGLIHNDGNDYNIIIAFDHPEKAGALPEPVVGIIDFGDMLHSYIICELAIAAAYVMLDKPDPLTAAAHMVRGYHELFPLTPEEVELLYSLICIRLCTSVAISAHQQKLEPDNGYLKISERPAWELLERLIHLPPNLAHYSFRQACGWPACPQTSGVVHWLKTNRDKIGPPVEPDPKTAPKVIFDLSIGSLELGNPEERKDTGAFTGLLFNRMKAAGAKVGLGRYNEARQIYSGELFRVQSNEIQERRTIHLGLDLFMEAGAPVLAPFNGKIHSFRNNTAPLDYGPTIIIEHEVEQGRIKFFTLYGHLSEESLKGLAEGKPVKKGDRIGSIGSYPANGDWPPHLHFQLITDMLGRSGEFPGVASPGQRDIWLSLSPDPNLVLDIPESCFPPPALNPEDILAIRKEHLGPSLSISYRRPLKIVRGYMQYLYDETGLAYLDAVNNVPHVGHCHPQVVKAGQQQMAVLNTNTRYLHDNLVHYAQRLCSLLPEPLRVCFFVCSGSEANDLALRLARTYTGQKDVVIVDGAYHGNLSSLIEISPYKFDGPGGSGAPPHVHKVIMPDPYRGPYRRDDPQAGLKYAQHVGQAVSRVRQQGRGVAAFFCESILSCGGQIVLPDHYLKEAYRYVREAGGLCVADEVQVGFGRTGTHFWAFETQEVMPDILTLGKPIGNGHPLAAVVTTPEIAAVFNNGMEYFNTFGGNPVSCAIGLAVLDVIETEQLQANALRVGQRLKAGLEQLMAKYPLIGDVRGLGLFIGIELVLDRATLAPAAAQAGYIIERMKEHGILISTDGPLHNVLKIKPPLVFSEENADFFVSTLDKILAEDMLRPVYIKKEEKR